LFNRQNPRLRVSVPNVRRFTEDSRTAGSLCFHDEFSGIVWMSEDYYKHPPPLEGGYANQKVRSEICFRMPEQPDSTVKAV
ncbi:MAG TPA: hypothetical protein VKB49_32035, partial [Candidatus Sulfotelmatobacter sp.]|nr:hypothetical protein [Candidatus Sulfotelmatobacter sp.]